MNNTMHLWDLANPGADPRILRGHEAYVRDVAFSSDGRTLASGSDDKTMRIWHLDNALIELAY